MLMSVGDPAAFVQHTYFPDATHYSTESSYFKLASAQNGSPATWSQFPATQNVDMAGYNLDAAGTVSAANVVADTGSITTLDVSGLTVATINGATYVPGTSWYLSPTLPVAPATGGVVKFVDASGNHELQAIDGNLYYDNELLAKAGDIQNVADWALYPALQKVDIDNQGLNNVGFIQVAGSTLATLSYGLCDVSGTVAATNLTAAQTLEVGTLNYPEVNYAATFAVDVDATGQIVFQNKNTGPNASAAIFVIEGGATDYMGVQVNSANYTQVDNTLFELPLAGVISHTTDMVIGAGSDHSANARTYLTYSDGTAAHVINENGAVSYTATYTGGTLNQGNYGVSGELVVSQGSTAPPTYTSTPSVVSIGISGTSLTNAGGTLTWNGQPITTGGGGSAANWSSFPAGSTVSMAGFGITGAGTFSGTQLNLSNVPLTNNAGTLTWNGQAITTGSGGDAANWANYAAVSNVNCNSKDFTAMRNLTAEGATFAGVLKVDDQNIEMLGSGNYLEVGENSIRVLAPTLGYNDVYFEANLKVGDPAALTGPEIEFFPSQFTMGTALAPISGGIFMTAGSLIQFTSPLINMLGANVAVGAGAVEIGSGNITVGTATSAGGGVNIYGGKLFLAPSVIGPPLGGNGGLVVSGTATIEANAIHDGDLGYVQIQEKTGSLSTNVVSINNISQLTSAPSTGGMIIQNVASIAGTTMAITGVSTINGAAYPPPSGITTWSTYRAISNVDISGFDIGNINDVSTDGLYAASLVSAPLYEFKGPTADTYLTSAVDGVIQCEDGFGVPKTLKAGDVILAGTTVDLTLDVSGGTRIGVTGGPSPQTIAYLSDVPTITKDTTEFWVSAQGSNSNSGSVVAPFQTIQFAITQAELVSSSGSMAIINVAPGLYSENLTFGKGYVTLATQATNENLAGQVIISGTVSIALTGSDDLFGRQVSFIGFQFDGGAGMTVLISDTSTAAHTLGFQNCYLFNDGASGPLLNVNTTATDCRVYFQNCTVQGSATASTALLTMNKGFLEIDKCDLTTAANIPCLLMTGTSRIQRCALNSFTNTNASNNLAPLINLNTAGFFNSVGNNTFAFSVGTPQTGGTPANICGILFDANTVTPPAPGIFNLLAVFNIFALAGTSDPANHSIAKITAGTTPVVTLYQNGCLPGTAHKVESGITTANCITVS
jgi:hypothetical protein